MIYDMRTYDLNPGALQAYMGCGARGGASTARGLWYQACRVVLYRYWEIKSRGSYLGVSRLYPF